MVDYAQEGSNRHELLPDESQLTTLPSIDMRAPEAEIVE